MEPRIAEIRNSKGLKQIHVAKLVGISQQQLSDYEHKRAYPRVDKAFRLAKVLECKVDELWEFKE